MIDLTGWQPLKHREPSLLKRNELFSTNVSQLIRSEFQIHGQKYKTGVLNDRLFEPVHFIVVD